MDHPGPMALCVKDLAILLQAIAGPDPYDPSTDHAPSADYLAALDRPASSVRLGRLHGLFDELSEPGMLAWMERVSEHLRRQGAEVVDLGLPTGFAEVLRRHRTVMAVEAASFHGPRLRRHPEDYGPNISALLEEGMSCPALEYAHCKEHQDRLSREIKKCLPEVDALLTPATRGPAPDAATTGDPAFNSPWSYTGLPTVSIPAGWSPDGLPLSIQLVGEPWPSAEAHLLAVAAWCERALEFERRTPPG
jgi:aspartyl-tRNA(Asn)/glutamyl-tRNA(Gln) amidotransferase subunit A